MDRIRANNSIRSALFMASAAVLIFGLTFFVAILF
jgi:hypothetical protein